MVKRKATWPGWRPTEALLKRRPTIPRDVAVKTATPEVMAQREWDDRPRSDNQVILFR